MSTLFHVTSTGNRASIERHGLDWTRMGALRGIAGSSTPEVQGVFLCRDEFEVDFFCQMDSNDGPVDVWAVDGVADDELVEDQGGFLYVAEPVPASRLTLREGVRMPTPGPATDTNGAAFISSLTIELDDVPTTG